MQTKERPFTVRFWLTGCLQDRKSVCLGCLVLNRLALDSTKELVVLIAGRLIREKGFLVKKVHQENYTQAPVCPTWKHQPRTSGDPLPGYQMLADVQTRSTQSWLLPCLLTNADQEQCAFCTNAQQLYPLGNKDHRKKINHMFFQKTHLLEEP